MRSLAGPRQPAPRLDGIALHDFRELALIGVEAGAIGLGTAAFNVLLLRITQKRFSATQYALFSSIFALNRTVAGPPAGVLIDALGWRDFFLLTVPCAIAGWMLALEAAKAFSAGKVDLAVVRGDVGDLSQAQAVVVVSHVVALIVAPPGSTIDSIDKLKGRRVGVIGGDANSKIVDVLSKEFGLDRAKVFKDIALPDARRALQSKEVNALLIVIPLAEKYLSLVRNFFQQGPKALPVLIPIESAGAIAEAERAYESFDIPKGTLRGSPPVPDDDLTTLRASLYLVAQKKLGADLITSLTQTIMRVRRDLMGEEPIFAQITAPSTDADAYLPLHPGAAAFYNSTQQSFMDEYGNWIYLTPMVLGAAATVLAAAWKFLGLGVPATREGPLDSLYALGRRIRNVGTEAELSDIEEEIDNILKEWRPIGWRV